MVYIQLVVQLVNLVDMLSRYLTLVLLQLGRYL